MASGPESKIPPTGDLIRGVPAPGGTWPDLETSPGGSRGRIYFHDADGHLFELLVRAAP